MGCCSSSSGNGGGGSGGGCTGLLFPNFLRLWWWYTCLSLSISFFNASWWASLKILSWARAAILCLSALLSMLRTSRWWSKNATLGDNADTSVCKDVTLLSSSEMYCSFLTLDLWADCRFANILLTRLGSTIGSPEEAGEFHAACGSDLHELSTSPGSFFGCGAGGCCCCMWSSMDVGLSSLLLFWSDGVEGLDDDNVGGTAADISSENMDISCSSSRRSNPDELRHSSAKETGASKKAIESLADRRWDPRLAEEKSRNSSTQEGCCWEMETGFGFPMEGILWWGKEGQFWVMFGTLGGSCAI